MRTLLIAFSIFALLGCTETKPAQASTPKTANVVAQPASKVAKPTGLKPVAAPTPVAARASQKYTVEVSPVTITAGGKATATLTVKPGAGLKFNKDYPSKFVVTAGRHAKAEVAQLSKKSGHVAVRGKLGVVSVPLVAVSKGSETLSIQGSFSVCSDEQCYVLRGESLSLAVAVK